ncbi:uncharacterized protein LOC115029974 [Mus caroli]|uniref:Uncharacterized protein LOC115029974 n=1 Tax=Mus caroli TaxID=10089 RepID=A0A6P7QII0_MUSCR|nr:uncharacterized protein LOC115029974 [Mus caroli]
MITQTPHPLDEPRPELRRCPCRPYPLTPPRGEDTRGSQNSREPGAVTPPGKEGARSSGKGGPTCYAVGGHRGAVLKGIPKPRTLGPAAIRPGGAEVGKRSSRS